MNADSCPLSPSGETWVSAVANSPGVPGKATLGRQRRQTLFIARLLGVVAFTPEAD